MKDLHIKEGYVVAPIEASFPVSEKARVVNIDTLIKKLSRKR
jgi:hypothetical protein